MNSKALCIAAVASVLLLNGCDKQTEKAEKIAGVPAPSAAAEAKPTPENTALIINGKPISRAYLQSIMAEMGQRNMGQPIPEDKVVDGLIARELLKQEAEKQNLAKDPAVQTKIENATRDALIQAAVENFRKTATVSEEELKKEYDTRVAALKGTEYKARHILLETEEAAKDVLVKLQKGGKFEELAKKLSKDPSAKQNGGELGWFNPQGYVKEFSEAVEKLKNGETTAAPVKSQFGWHVIQREDSREQAPPEFDKVKEQFRNMLVSQKLQKHVEELKNSAKIERLADPAKKDAAAKPATPTNTNGEKPAASLEAGKPATPPAAAPAAK